MIFQRQTLSNDVRLSGRGLHSGQPVNLIIRPGEQGIIFRCGKESVVARPENVTDTKRCTRLGGISTVEHLMSAFAGLEITDAEVELDYPELPALDGASLTYVSAMRETGTVEIGMDGLEGPFARIFEKGDEHQISIAQGDGWWRYIFSTGDRWPGEQDFEIHLTPESYYRDIAPARTFAFEEEYETVRAAGLGQGLDGQNAFLIGGSGYVNETKFADEPARHKLLDLIGDLYLAGVPTRFLNVVAERSGHTANVSAAVKLSRAISKTSMPE